MKKYVILTLNFYLLSFSGPIFTNILDNLILEPGFNISIYADNLDSPRQMVEGKNGVIFVGERNGRILALRDMDNNGQVDSKIVIADGLTYSTGVSLFDGDLYFSEISQIWKI